jgi:hypothetical protein
MASLGFVRRSYFSWGPGERRPGLYSYAGGTIVCNKELELLPGNYPLIERYDASEQFELEMGFNPRHKDDGVVFHVILHERYRPVRTGVFIQPQPPSAYKDEDKIVLTYPTNGRTEIKFNVSPLREGESLSDFDVSRLVTPEEKQEKEIELGVNAWFLSGKWKRKYS